MASYDIKRIYESADASDGFRVLVDRLWPRGISKQKAALDLWLKDIGPSSELRKWFGHQPELFPEFEKRYEHELVQNPAVSELQKLATKHAHITLLYSAHDTEHNQANVLREYLSR